MLAFDDNCDDLAIYKECSMKIMKKLDIDFNGISEAAADSFKETDN